MRIDGVTFRASSLAIILVAASGCGPRRGPPASKVPVSVARAELRALPYELEATGTVEPIRSVDVRPQVGGTILRVYFGEGDEVAAGQVLLKSIPGPTPPRFSRPWARCSVIWRKRRPPRARRRATRRLRRLIPSRRKT